MSETMKGRLRRILSTPPGEFHYGRFLITVLVAGVLGGLISSFYLFVLNGLVTLVWDIIFFAMKNAGCFGDNFPEYNFIWIGSLIFVFPLCVLIRIFPNAMTGEFGDAVRTIHEEGKIPSKYVLPMFFFSMLSVASGAGVGPEAPILVIGGGCMSYIGELLELPIASMRAFSLAGTYAALSAFFGSPISGVHALEFPHKIGMEFFEGYPAGIMASFISSTILQLFFRKPYGDIFHTSWSITQVEPIHVFESLALAAVSTVVCIIFWAIVTFYRWFVKYFHFSKYPYLQPLGAWIVFSVAGMLLPPILFWGDPDLQNIFDNNQTPLERWKGNSSGIIDLGETYSVTIPIVVGFVKMLVLGYCVTNGMRGGVLFPLFSIGGSFGQAAYMLTGVDQGLALGCMMAAVQAGITRTPLASSLVTAFIFYEYPIHALIPIACCCFTTYYATYYFPLFAAQRHRSDILGSPGIEIAMTGTTQAALFPKPDDEEKPQEKTQEKPQEKTKEMPVVAESGIPHQDLDD